MPEKRYEEYDLAEAEAMDEQKDEEEKKPCLTRLAERPCILFCIYVGLIGYGVFSIIFDWLWVSDMLKTEDGLVFGKPRDVTIAFLIVIASVGMVAFILEMVGFSLKVFKGKPLMDEDLAQVLTLFLEEVPSITFSFLLAQCREVPVSYYQLAKAALQMLGAGFRALRCLIRYFSPEKHRWTGWVPWLLRTFVFATSLYCVIAACLVWVFTYVTPPEEGAEFKPPGTIIDKSYDNGRYFYKAAIYFSHPSFAHCLNNDVPWNETRINWIKLQSIYDTLEAEQNGVQAIFYYNSNINYITVTNNDLDGPTECYIVDISNNGNCLVESNTGNCNPPDLSTVNTISFKFEPRERTKTLVFGDIKFNSKIGVSSTCYDLDIDEWGFLSYDAGEIQAQMHYFKMLDENFNDTYVYYEDTSGSLRPYQFNVELANITDVWVTGYDKCPMTGSYRPNEDSNIEVNCPTNFFKNRN